MKHQFPIVLKVFTVYLRVRPFWIYTIVSFFFKTFSPLLECVLKILSILKKKKNSNSTSSRPVRCTKNFDIIIIIVIILLSVKGICR